MVIDHLNCVNSKGLSHLAERIKEPWTFDWYVLGIIIYPASLIGLSPPKVVSIVIYLTGKKFVWFTTLAGS